MYETVKKERRDEMNQDFKGVIFRIGVAIPLQYGGSHFVIVSRKISKFCINM
jgi:hypothetical protein